MTAVDLPSIREAGGLSKRVPTPYGACALIGLGGLFAGVTGPAALPYDKAVAAINDYIAGVNPLGKVMPPRKTW